MKKMFVALMTICLLLCSCYQNEGEKVEQDSSEVPETSLKDNSIYDEMRMIYSRDNYNIYGELVDFFYDYGGTTSHLMLETESGDVYEVKGFAPNVHVNDAVTLNTILLRNPEMELKHDIKALVFFDDRSGQYIHTPKDIVLFPYESEEDAQAKKIESITKTQNLSDAIITNFEGYEDLQVINKEQAIKKLIEVNGYENMKRNVDIYGQVTYYNDEIRIEPGRVSYNTFTDEDTEKYVKFDVFVTMVRDENLMESYIVYANGKVVFES